MSTPLTKQPENILPFLSTSQRVLKRILSDFRQLDPRTIATLDELPTEKIIELWKEFEEFERHVWVWKAAMCSNIWQKGKTAKRGRGNKDVNQQGILARVSKLAKRIDLTPRRVYTMAEIFNLICKIEDGKYCCENNILDILDEQGYWEVALTSTDSCQAIVTFAEKKTTLPRFRVTDARRLLETSDLCKKQIKVENIEAVPENKLPAPSQSLVEHIRSSQDVIRNLIIPGCPDASFTDRFWNELLLELEEEYQELFDTDACKSLRQAWLRGNRSEDYLAKHTKLPLQEVSRLMQKMSLEFIKVQVRDPKRRNGFQVWHMVGKPFDNAKYMPMA